MLLCHPWVVAPPWPDHLFPMAEGLCCPVYGRTKLRGAPRMDEHRENERLAGRPRFFPCSLPFLHCFRCLLSDRWCAREILFVLFSELILSCPPQCCCLYMDDRTARGSQSRKPSLILAILQELHTWEESFTVMIQNDGSIIILHPLSFTLCLNSQLHNTSSRETILHSFKALHLQQFNKG